MKLLVLIPVAIAISCSSPKKTAAQRDAERVADSLARIAAETIKNPAQHPACIDSLVKVFEADNVQNPPRRIYAYTYKEKRVYYVPAICCDFFSDLYDSDCNLIGHPDGGFTGKGDGKLPDFASARKDEVLIWKDKRGK